MKLKSNVPRAIFNIRSPIWDGRKVGLNIDKLQKHNEVRCLYKNIYGDLVHPNPYYIEREKALTYPKQILNRKGWSVKLVIIPLADMEVLESEV